MVVEAERLLQQRIALAALGADEPVAPPAHLWLVRHLLDEWASVNRKAGWFASYSGSIADHNGDRLGVGSYQLCNRLSLEYSPAGCVDDRKEQELLQPSDGADRICSLIRNDPANLLRVIEVIDRAIDDVREAISAAETRKAARRQ